MQNLLNDVKVSVRVLVILIVLSPEALDLEDLKKAQGITQDDKRQFRHCIVLAATKTCHITTTSALNDAALSPTWKDLDSGPPFEKQYPPPIVESPSMSFFTLQSIAARR